MTIKLETEALLHVSFITKDNELIVKSVSPSISPFQAVTTLEYLGCMALSIIHDDMSGSPLTVYDDGEWMLNNDPQINVLRKYPFEFETLIEDESVSVLGECDCSVTDEEQKLSITSVRMNDSLISHRQMRDEVLEKIKNDFFAESVRVFYLEVGRKEGPLPQNTDEDLSFISPR